MKKLVLTALVCTLALSLQAAGDKKPDKKNLTEEQKKLQKEMLEKYDADKSGKIDKQERGKISTEDKAKMEKAGIIKDKKDK